jgi:hypothetical protein
MTPLAAITSALTGHALTSRALRADVARSLGATRPAEKYLSGYVRAAIDLGLVVMTARRGEGVAYRLSDDVPVSRAMGDETSRALTGPRKAAQNETSCESSAPLPVVATHRARQGSLFDAA